MPSSNVSPVIGSTILRNVALLATGGCRSSALSALLLPFARELLLAGDDADAEAGGWVISNQTFNASGPEMRRMAMADLDLPVAGAKMVAV